MISTYRDIFPKVSSTSQRPELYVLSLYFVLSKAVHTYCLLSVKAVGVDIGISLLQMRKLSLTDFT